MPETQNNNMIANNNDEIVNIEQFEDMRDLLEEDFADLVEVYFTDAQQRIVKLRQAQQGADNANGFELAHALKGASANLGTTQLMNLSSQLQELCREQRINESAQLVETIAIALDNAKQDINQRLGQ